MLTDTKTVVSALLVVLFLTMILFSPSVLDVSYFLTLIVFVFKFVF